MNRGENNSEFLQMVSRHANSASRKFALRYLSDFINYYVVNEYPKSGGSWLGMMLSEVLQVSFPRNSRLVFKSSIMHGHFMAMNKPNRIVVISRDGRDVLVSWYYHCLFENEINNHALVKDVKSRLNFKDLQDIESNLPEFIEFCFERQRHPKFSWADFVKKWANNDSVVHTSYEKLRSETSLELKRITRELTGTNYKIELCESVAEKFSFRNMSNRPLGVANNHSFIRKGIVGDWKSVFSAESKDIFNHYAGNELLLLGYERDSTWAVQ